MATHMTVWQKTKIILISAGSTILAIGGIIIGVFIGRGKASNTSTPDIDTIVDKKIKENKKTIKSNEQFLKDNPKLEKME